MDIMISFFTLVIPEVPYMWMWAEYDRFRKKYTSIFTMNL